MHAAEAWRRQGVVRRRRQVLRLRPAAERVVASTIFAVAAEAAVEAEAAGTLGVEKAAEGVAAVVAALAAAEAMAAAVEAGSAMATVAAGTA